jgi:hypothetical protein
MRAASMATQRKVHEIADEIIETGAFETQPASTPPGDSPDNVMRLGARDAVKRSRAQRRCSTSIPGHKQCLRWDKSLNDRRATGTSLPTSPQTRRSSRSDHTLSSSSGRVKSRSADALAGDERPYRKYPRKKPNDFDCHRPALGFSLVASQFQAAVRTGLVTVEGPS